MGRKKRVIAIMLCLTMMVGLIFPSVNVMAVEPGAVESGAEEFETEEPEAVEFETEELEAEESEAEEPEAEGSETEGLEAEEPEAKESEAKESEIEVPEEEELGAEESEAQEPASEGAEFVILEDGEDDSATEGARTSMEFYEGAEGYSAFYEGKVTLTSGTNEYRIYINGEKAEEGTIEIEGAEAEDIWIRYFEGEEGVVTQYNEKFLYPAVWTGEFSKLTKKDGTKYLDFFNWSTTDTNASLSYKGGGIFEKEFTFDAMEDEQELTYKITFNGGWDNAIDDGSGGNRTLTFPEGSESVTIWVNSLTKDLKVTLYPESGETEEPSEETPEECDVDLGRLVQVSVNGGAKNLMNLYKDGMYEGEVSLTSGANTYQIYIDGEKIKEGDIEEADAGDSWIRYSVLNDEVVTRYDEGFLYPATWTGGFDGLTKADETTKYLYFENWSPGDTNANLDYKGGGVFQKTFTFDAMESGKELDYKIAFGGDWNHGAVPNNDKHIDFPEGTESITLWVNSLTSETYDSINDVDSATTETVQMGIDDTDHDMVQIGFHTFIGTVQLGTGKHTWNIAGKSGSFDLSEEKAVTFYYDDKEGTILNSVMKAATLATVINYPASNDSGTEFEPETDLKDVKFGEILEISINGGAKSLMSPYYNGMFEGEVKIPSGKSTYRIYRNDKLAKIGEIAASSRGTAWIRYWSFQDKVVTSYDKSDGFKYPATWVGKFSTVSNLADLNLGDWQPSDSDGDLEYKGGGVFQRTFSFKEMEEDKELLNGDDDPGYKIAFCGDWAHGDVGLNGGNKPLTFPAGSKEITLWVNSLTSENYDSINEKGKVTLEPVKIYIDDDDYEMIQTGFHTFIKTVLLEESKTYSWTCTTGSTQSLEGDVTNSTDRTAVTFWYDAENNKMYNSIDDLEELEGLTNWLNTLNSNYSTYDGGDLGAVYTPSSTMFKVWAPTASKVVLNRYAKGSTSEESTPSLGTTPMEKDGTAEDWNGVWTTTVTGDLKNTYYTYSVTAGGTTKETNDIYAKAVGLNGDRGMVVDLDSTDPSGWAQDSHVKVDEPTDAIVWEVNISDFSSAGNSGISAENSGKYLAFTEKGTTVNGSSELSTGIDYLKDLGVNYVQLLPVFDFVNDETAGSYNWGYAPKNYNVPEGIFSTDPSDGNVRIKEFKQMVQALHENEIGVVMDVVFNHVGGDGKESWFNRTVPGYYFRQDEWGNFVDSGTACGNETASEAEMFRKYMIDSVVYWAEEYHIDGFRFDLMGCHDVETMNQLRAALDKLDGGEKILVYGEPWAAGTTNQPEGVEMVDKDSNHNTFAMLDERIGAFSNNMRDSLKGEQWQDEKGFNKGFVQGAQQVGDKSADVKLIGSIQANSNLGADEPWAKQPSQVVSYVSVHDDLSLYDKLQRSVNGVEGVKNPKYYEYDSNLVKMNKMAAAVLATSQGMMFFQAGEEMARSKGGDHNSYESPLFFTESGVEYELNAINWERSEKFSDLVEYYKGLLKLRKAYAPFTASDMSTVNNMTFSEGNENLIAYTINSPGAKWDMVAVVMNSNTESQQVTLKAVDGVELPDAWNCVVNQESAGTEKLEMYLGTTITVPAQTVLVLTAANQDDLKAELTAVIAQYEQLEKSEDFSDEDWEAFQAALQAARDIAADENATAEQISEAINNLKSAAGKLTKATDKTQLEELLEKYKDVEGDDAFKAAYAHAQEILKNPDATQEEINDAVAALEEAYRNSKPDDPTPEDHPGLWIRPIPAQTYTGAAIKPEIEVYHDGKLLTIKKDYTVAYKQNTNVGTATVTVTGKGNFKGKDTETFKIEKKDIGAEDISVADVYAIINNKGKVTNPKVTVKYGKKTLKNNNDYKVVWPEDDVIKDAEGNIKVGVYDITITTKDVKKQKGEYVDSANYTGSKKIKYTVRETGTQLMSKAVIKLTDTKVDYAGENGAETKKPGIKSIKIGGKDVPEGEYTVSYDDDNWNKIGKATVTVTANEGSVYYGSKSVTYTVNGTKLVAKDLTIGGINAAYDYTGEPIYVSKNGSNSGTLTVTRSKGVEESVVLEEDKDYEVSYKTGKKLDEHTNVGTVTVTIIGINAYTGSINKTFKITAVDLATFVGENIPDGCKFKAEGTAKYTKTGAKPEITELLFNGTDLVEKQDYTVTYAKNKAVVVGKESATMTIKGKGNFKGQIKHTYEVTKASETDVEVKATDIVKPTKFNKLKPTVKVVELSTGKALKAGTDYDKGIKYYSNKTCLEESEITAQNFSEWLSGLEADRAVTVYAKVVMKGNYAGTGETPGSLVAAFNLYSSSKKITDTKKYEIKVVTNKTAMDGDIACDKKGNPIYTGYEIEPKVTVTPKGTDTTPLKPGTDYVVSYVNHTNKGKATVTVTGIGEYGGTKSLKFTIVSADMKWYTAVTEKIATFFSNLF